MNVVKGIGIGIMSGMIFLSGCAPSVTVTHAGSDRQYEVTVQSSEFSFSDTESTIEAWHKEARKTCHGGNYRVITRDIIERHDPVDEITITGIIECE